MRLRLPRCSGLPFLCLLLAGITLAACKEEKNTYVPPPPAQVGVSQPLQLAVVPYLEATGNTAAFNQVDLEARIQGFLTAIDYVDGAAAKQGDTLFVIEPAPYQAALQQAQATLAATQAELIAAEAEYKRQATLLAQNVSAQNTYDQALAKRDSLRAQAQNNEAAVTQAAINYGYTRVTAPFDGIVSNHLQSVGELVGYGAPTKLATIVQLDPIYVYFTISEQQLIGIREAAAKMGLTRQDINKVPIEVGLMTEQGFPHRGKLDYSAPFVDTATSTLTVRGIFENKDHALLPGFFVRIRVPLGLEAQGKTLLVPDIVLGADQAGQYLLVVNKDNVVEQRKVTTGQAYGELRAITAGLEPTDRVVVSGLQKAIPGAKVDPQPAEIPKPAGLPPASKP
ncbi:MAG: efflux RND transporter periplasmic adaptor subunit [Proteobacteria bacterium]|nr:efflux RND transporter periplasmic adaptor subunit [Pseudomonadota bacterium]